MKLTWYGQSAFRIEIKGATILIESSGPCVLTAGSDSDEVRDLENQPE